MRRLFTTKSSGLTISALKWGERNGRWVRVQRAVYAEGPEPPTPLDRERARVLASSRPARGALAGVLHGLDGVMLDGRPTRRDGIDAVIVAGLPCADARQTLMDLTAIVDDDTWEQALESALRKRLVTTDELTGARSPRIRRVLDRRPPGAPPTESLLETLALQLSRVAGLSDAVRQHEVFTADGTFVARVDLAWPDDGFFFELDGQQHKDQPVYDARRETAVVAATGMLPGRFTWYEVTRIPHSTSRRMSALAGAAWARRPAA